MIPWKNFLYFLTILLSNLPSLNPSSIPHHAVFRRELPTRKYKFVSSSTIVPISTTTPSTTPTPEEQEIIDLFSPYDKDEPTDPNDMRIDQKLAHVGDQLPPPLSFIFPATKPKNPKDPKPPEIEELFSRDEGSDDGGNGTTGPKYDKFGRLINSTLAGSLKRQEKSIVKQVRNKTLLIIKSDLYKNLPENQNKNSSEIERIKNFTRSFVKAGLTGGDGHNTTTTTTTTTSAYKVDFYFRSTTTGKPRPTRKQILVEEIGDLDENLGNLEKPPKLSADIVTKKIKKPLKIEDYIDEQEENEEKKLPIISKKKPVKIIDDFDYDEVPSTKKTTKKPIKKYEDDDDEEIQIKPPTKKTTKKPIVDDEDDENEVKIVKKVVKKPVIVVADNDLDVDLDIAQSKIGKIAKKPNFKADIIDDDEDSGRGSSRKNSRKRMNSDYHDDHHDLRFEGLNYNY